MPAFNVQRYSVFMLYPLIVVITMMMSFMAAPANAINQNVRTRVVTDTGLTCTTGVGETSCDITLSEAHQYYDTSRMTVTETAPGAGDVTANTTVGSDRQTLTIASLSASTMYTFTVAFRGVAANMGADSADIVNFTMPAIVFGTAIAMTALAAFVLMAAPLDTVQVLGTAASAVILAILFMPVIGGLYTSLADSQDISGFGGLYDVMPFMMLLSAFTIVAAAVLRVRRQGL